MLIMLPSDHSDPQFEMSEEKVKLELDMCVRSWVYFRTDPFDLVGTRHLTRELDLSV